MATPQDMELVAMVMATIPSPPMPLIVGKEVPDEITVVSGEHIVCNSHDLLGMLLLTAMSRNEASENMKRKTAQEACLHALFRDVGAVYAGAAALSVSELHEKVYEAFGTFTRGYIASLSSSQDVRFAPLRSIQREDRVHIATCHHAAAQDIVYGKLKTDNEGESRTAEQFSAYPYTSLMMRQAARFEEAVKKESGEEDKA